jgi:hypothetical protein
VHRRAVPENLLAVEVRKATNHQPIEHDHHKLRGLTDPHLWFATASGVLLVFGQGTGQAIRRLIRVSPGRDRPGAVWLVRGPAARHLVWRRM